MGEKNNNDINSISPETTNLTEVRKENYQMKYDIPTLFSLYKIETTAGLCFAGSAEGNQCAAGGSATFNCNNGLGV